MIIRQQPIPQDTGGGSIAAVARTNQFGGRRDRSRCARDVVSSVDAYPSPKTVVDNNIDTRGHNRIVSELRNGASAAISYKFCSCHRSS
jgi:hypothetical protein